MAKKEFDIKATREQRFMRKDSRKTILIVCGVLAILIFAIAVLNMMDEIDFSLKGFTQNDTNNDGVCNAVDANSGYDSNGDGCPDQGEYSIRRGLNFIVFGLIVLFGPYGFYVSKKEKELKDIEKRIPDFLRDVAEAGRFGMTLSEAIVVSSSGRYGPLTSEIKKMAAQIQWGVPVTTALNLFAERLNTQMSRRIVAIINKSSEAGGNVADVLTMVSRNAKETQLMEDERSLTMKTYLTVILISFFVFLVTIWILNATFLPKMLEASSAVSEASEGASGGLQSGGVLTAGLAQVVQQIQVAFFIAAIVHAIGDGILAGVLENGKMANGMKYSFIMLISGFVILEFLA